MHCNGLQAFATFTQCTATHRGVLSVCQSAFSILAKWLSGLGRGLGWWLDWGFVLAYSILVVIVEREGAVLGGGKFGTFHCNQWDCLREGMTWLFPSYFGLLVI